MDFHLIPYMIGSLYGGWPALALLTLICVIVQYPTLDNFQELASFILFTAGFVMLMSISYRPFHQLSALRKERNGLLLMSVLMLYLVITLTGSVMEWTFDLVLEVVLTVSATLLATWLSIFIIESVKEKQLLHEEVTRLSVNYRNEVEKLQQFIDVTSFAVIVVDCEGRITHYNEMALKLLHIRIELTESGNLLGTYYSKAFQPGQGDLFVNMISQALNGTRATLVPFVSGDKMLLKTTFSLRSLLNNEAEGAALMVQDVTELSQLRNEVGRMERLSLVGQMAASITHEIRNPLAVIRGFVQLIQERSPASQREYFQIVMEELDRANMIISDFLSLAQNRALTMELSSLNDILNELLPLLNADANLRGQTIDTSLCEDMPLIMLNDREIKQMFLNIARNGMEAMDDHGVLQISTHYWNDRIELRIADNGEGIAQDKMVHLFEPFFTTKTRGTGLGLPLCLSIVERHNGKIDVNSIEGEGTTFIVTFYLQQEEKAV
ncbi:ATP-binding protein [Paenibacillus castaneae]|uniref:ATP-binding protein n=1 Tax=Paenibacillus castaneae TaxID=474957 RepID=UPI001FBB4D26|nr:ATP-binding protein [Paenibacillus castaneae]